MVVYTIVNSMAKDYFQDIVPPHGSPKRTVPVRAVEDDELPASPEPAETAHAEPQDELPHHIDEGTPAPVERSIRNIPVTPRTRARPMADVPRYGAPPKKRATKWIIWVVAAVCILMVGALILVATRGTSVSVTPRVQTVVFDQSSRFTAFPASSAATGTLSYTVETLDFEEYENVPSTGTEHAEEKARGTVTVYNGATASAMRLVANTRFETPDGHIFRAQSPIVVPGKSGTTPGSVEVTIVADGVGGAYNVAGPVKLTIPGLKSSPNEYANVYAEADEGLSGGFVGERPTVSESDRNAARASVRTRLDEKVRTAVAEMMSDERFAFADLALVSFEDVTEPGTGSDARVGSKAHASVPLFPASDFASYVARTVSADADDASVRLLPADNFAVQTAGTYQPGADPIQFTMSGSARIVWDVDTNALSEALAGKDQEAFQSIVNAFPGIQTARARIQPFWSSTFPTEPSAITVTVEKAQ
jgi:hypothetical protein